LKGQSVEKNYKTETGNSEIQPTQKSIAKKARINAGVLSQIANGKLIPNHRQRQRIAVALGIHEEDLFET